jgi:amidophosphoribosyltransferase
VREIEPGEMVVITEGGVESRPFRPRQNPRFCIFEYMSISRAPTAILGGRSVYETRRQIGVELAREAPVEADLVCPVPDSGTPAAIGYSQESGIPYAMGIIRNQYMGRTFIEPTEQIRNMGVRLKLNVNRALIEGKRVILVDDSVVRGTTSRKIKDMILDAGAAEVHFRIASPPTAWPCFYGVDTPQREKTARRIHERGRDARPSGRRFAEVHLARRALPRRRRGGGRDPATPRNIAMPVSRANTRCGPPIC